MTPGPAKQRSSTSFGALAVLACTLLCGAYAPASAGDWTANLKLEPPKQQARVLDLSVPSHLGLGGAATAHPFNNYGPGVFAEQASSAWLETAALFGAITYIGYTNWNWGNSGFRFHDEGWFGPRTASGGNDKLGHAYTTYIFTDLLTHAIRRNSSNPYGAEWTAATLAMALMFYVEVFDGYSGDHGFSKEDLIADLVGAGFSVLRNTVPGLREKLDFRMEYIPSGYKGFAPLSDYAGQKFLLAIKLAGFEDLKQTPLRFVELHAGYYTRGFSIGEWKDGIPKSRDLYVGIGLNLQELLFGHEAVRDHWAARTGRTVLEYVQVPYTYVDAVHEDRSK